MPRFCDHQMDVFIGQRIKRRRKELGQTQQQLGGALGISYQQVQKYETGRSQISATLLLKVSASMGLPVSYFFSDRDRNDLASTPVRFALPDGGNAKGRISYHYGDFPKRI